MTTPSKLLNELKQLRVNWRNQNFKFTGEQKKRYEELKELRRKRVQSFYATDRVWKGPSMAGKKKEEKEKKAGK